MYIAFVILGFSALRLAVASLTSLGNDEVYYFTYAVQPDWNHFDHPPLVGIFIRLFTFNLRWTDEIALRMPAIVGAAVNTMLIARCGRMLADKAAGLLAAIFYNACIYTSIISGTFILPDSVQLTFWLLATQAALNAINTQSTKNLNLNLLLFGICTGLAVMCKVHGMFLWAGLFGFIVLRKRSWLKNPVLFLACGLTVLISSPILFWNLSNDFISWQFHSERVEMNQGIQLKSFLANVIGQVLYFNPVLIFIAVMSVTGIIKQWRNIRSDNILLLLGIGCPIILATAMVSLFRPTLPHWSGPGYLAIMLLSAIYISHSVSEQPRYINLTKASVALILVVFVAGTLVILYFPGALSDKSAPHTGKNDATLDMYHWEDLQAGFEILRDRDIADRNMSAAAPVVVYKWFPGAHIYYYAAYPMKMRVRAVGKVHDLHKFQWMNGMSANCPAGSDAYYITPSNDFTDPQTIFQDHFRRIEKSGTVTQRRSGKIARRWYVYRLKNASRPF
ncbi:ArnT family glycosyltransferase [Dyadobacter aurulentus]|uniref:ArnT family glycosyltransferase n=1 Tax=Dyadobacter sp. UC 10 TaxID=2605428 RepID=UPI0011F1E703|nr:glycosyltransferase family 39 protein [Dyadobacter sp. UC 10]KAA0993343.1 phospholipid carrier-dependent glycosyltransferase [Dyadobacter sp. UC 10]